jgi:hypothetical protein
MYETVTAAVTHPMFAASIENAVRRTKPPVAMGTFNGMILTDDTLAFKTDNLAYPLGKNASTGGVDDLSDIQRDNLTFLVGSADFLAFPYGLSLQCQTPDGAYRTPSGVQVA